MATVTAGRATWGRYKIDLDVYRLGSQLWIHGRDLYGQLPLTAAGLRLPFTYPPLAAVVLSPLSLVSLSVASAVITATTVALLALVTWMVLVSLRIEPRLRPWLVGGSLPVLLLLEPVRSTLGYGQINVILMALVVADCLVRAPRWPRGLMIGVAAALKLTPAVFLVYLLVRRDTRAAVTAVLSAVAATLVGFVAAPADSWHYWTKVVFDTGRIGNVAFCQNQSIMGVLYRLGVTGPARTLLWLLASAAVLAAVVVLARRSFASGSDAWAMSFVALAELLVSPISWTHHWVWVAPIGVTLVVTGWRRRSWPVLAFGALGLLVFGLGSRWGLPKPLAQGNDWGAGHQLLNNSYVWYAVVLLVAGLVATRGPRRAGVGGAPRAARDEPAPGATQPAG